MDLIAIESQAFQDLVDKLNRIEQYVERTSHLLQDIDDELEMSTKDLVETLMISESTLYRWRKKQLIRYRYTESGDVRYFFKSILIAVKSNRLRVSGMRNEDLIGRLNRFKDNLIRNSCLNRKNDD
ncbi:MULTISPECIES: MerR family transcriptional regulator [Bacteroidales]|uniref:DNA-binding protein n=2 Tax=Bacteroidales TaxID=171549 RepID=A0A3P2ACF1_9BACE|nr:MULTISPECIES: MerR family transcriptional regulator [Bacteroidales]KGL47576.1 MerR family transcriptional regulator [Porphyromonas gulae]KGL49011.1 MerR family transcriptional regulator [Porphyromonas cangingivalis]KGN91457.1 MerR family transcriptional regulator [Porphyromonas canoris]RRD92505.1 DNA-binding protein [Bacteroides heparinolyticus]